MAKKAKQMMLKNKMCSEEVVQLLNAGYTVSDDSELVSDSGGALAQRTWFVVLDLEGREVGQFDIRTLLEVSPYVPEAALAKLR